jgi:N-acetyl-1-D-myo-inositol-2-amino-2-deoxy-alpha-D-glucopyranoside deacetylase
MVQERTRTLVAVHAHPDDESITMGGTLARYSAEGVRTVLVTCTGGELGPIRAPSLARPETLGTVRADELAEAARILGLSRVVRLGYRDSGLGVPPDQLHPASFCAADFDEATERLVWVLRAERPDVLLTYDERGGYGHPDHVRAQRVAAAAFAAAGDPARFPSAGPAWCVARLYQVVFPRRWAAGFVARLRAAGIAAPDTAPVGIDAGLPPDQFGTPDDLVTTVLDVGRYAGVKHAALAAHRTQVGSDHFLVRMPPDLAREVWRYEFYRRVDGPVESRPEDDLFDGLPTGPPWLTLGA